MTDTNNNTPSDFQKNLASILATYQQNEEFVDMTLAADGHIVKVHQMVLAYSSPYLKDLIQSAPGGHPVIHLTGVPREVLKCMLEYIYRGETQVTIDHFPKFLATAKDLHLKGMEAHLAVYEANSGKSTNDAAQQQPMQMPAANVVNSGSDNAAAEPSNRSRKKRRRAHRRSARQQQANQAQEANIEASQQNERPAAPEAEEAPADRDSDDEMAESNEEETADDLEPNDLKPVLASICAPLLRTDKNLSHTYSHSAL